MSVIIEGKYKETKFGLIPYQWKIKTLEEIGNIVSGLTYSPNNIHEDGILVLRSSNVKNRQIELEDNVFVAVDKDNYNSVKENDLLICVRNGSRSLIGKNALIKKEHEGLAFGAFMSIFRSEDNSYLYQLFDTDIYNREIHRNLGATINSINGGNLKKFKFPFPPKEERDRITQILSTWDEAIETTQKLIAQLQLRKKGLMQELLSGKKRLNGFTEEWELTELKSHLIKHSEVSTQSSQYPVLTSSRRGMFFQTDYYTREVASKDNTGYNVVPRGYLTYRHMSDDLIFKFNINTLCDKGIVSTLYPVFTTKDTLKKQYLLNILNEGEEFKRYALKQKQGGSRTYMYFGKLEKLKIPLPKIEEQKAILNFINTLQSEINGYGNLLETQKGQKKGLMQQLLTGKKRVKLNH